MAISPAKPVSPEGVRAEEPANTPPVTSPPIPGAASSARIRTWRHSRPISMARRRTQRANSRLSTGPRTSAGKYRSALNGQIRRVLPEDMEREQRARGEDPREFCRLHRDLIAIFRPRHPEISAAVMMLASAWWQKTRRIRQWVGAGLPQSAELDARIEALLVLIVSEMRAYHEHWKTALASIVGDLIGSPSEVRRHMEERLTLFGGKPAARKREARADRDAEWDRDQLRKRIDELISAIMAEAAKTAGREQPSGGSQHGQPTVMADKATEAKVG